MGVFGVRKPIGESDSKGGSLQRSLSWPHLVALGVGAIVGTGIYTLVGVGAERAGPAVMVAFAIAGAVCACAAMSYAELATMIPASGSAYTYTYSAIGERIAWIVGWSLILEYTVVCAAVAVGWSGYMKGFLITAGFPLPDALAGGPDAGGILNLPAVVIIVAVALLLLRGTKESATVNAILVSLKIAALAMFVVVVAPHFDISNFKPFMPYGFVKNLGPDGEARGVMSAAAIVFFAFYGFDAVTTAAEECKNPKRDLTLGILGSMLACVVIYIAVIAAALGARPFESFMHTAEPLAKILRDLNSDWAAGALSFIVIIALPTVILAFMFGQTRIFYVMARDGMFPERFGSVNEKTGTPVAMTLATAAVVSVIAAFLPLGEIAQLANTGTLCAFTAVSASMLALRVRDPERKREFKAPLPWVIAPVAIAGCLYLFYSLPFSTQWRFFAWNGVGLLVYVFFARKNSRIAAEARDAG